MKAVYTMTRASAGDFVPLTIESATASDGILSVTISGANLDNDAFVHRNNPASARLKISDGSNEIVSDYIQLIPVGVDYIDKNGINFGPGIIIDDAIWAPVNCGSTESDIYGEYYDYKGSLNACPLGWRTPTIDEFKSLAMNCSSPYLHSTWYKKNEIFGLWFSGSKAFFDTTPSVFFPVSGILYRGELVRDHIVHRSSSLKYSEEPYTFSCYGGTSVSFDSYASSDRKIAVRCVKE